MKRDASDGLPVTGTDSSSKLGARPRLDVAIDESGRVVPDTGGMSVMPNWRDLRPTRIPKRLRSLYPGASGPDTSSCYTMGDGRFERGLISNGLELIPDRDKSPVIHGVIAPVRAVPFVEYQSDLEATRGRWRVDEA